MARVALYGGAFDPPHSAHVFAVTWLLGAADVDEVWLLPTAQHTFAKAMSPFEVRCGLLEAALAPFDPARVRVCRVEAERPGVSRTFDTLSALAERYPAHDFRLVIGADNLAERHRWHRFDELVTRWPVIAFGRPGFEGALAAVEGAPWCTAGPTLPDVSSTAIRAALAGVGDPAALRWLPAAVEGAARGLYGGDGQAPLGPVAVLGHGRAGAAFAAAFRAAGIAVRTWNRSPQRGADADGPWPTWLADCRIWVLGISDPAIAEVAATLADHPAAAGRTVLHLAGRLGAEVLAPLAAVGAHTGSLHAMQSLRGAESAGHLRGAWCGCEGDGVARAAARALATRIGALPVDVPAGAKGAWHGAAVLSANFITPLAAGGQALLQTMGLDPETARQVLAPLQRGTVEHTARVPAVEALTGPLARGDLAAVADHVAALAARAPTFLPAYQALARTTAAWLDWPPAQHAALEAALTPPGE
ncbi:MAG: DUF2520 domain-containing protein [Myxococcales bacterium]|nr:DUF2520 domain-containing protein [Myxococcales bacterium]